MITDTHTSYLRIMLRTSQDKTRGWQGLIDHAVPRCPEAILAELRSQLSVSEQETEGWRSMHDYAAANLALPAELAQAEAQRLAADVAQYSTGARLDAPPRTCTCGQPDAPWLLHRSDGHPCLPLQYRNDGPSPSGVQPVVPELPPCTCGLPGTPGMWHRFDEQPCEVIPPDQPVPGEPPADGGQDPTATAVMPQLSPEDFVDQVAARSRQDSALRRLGEVDESEDGPQHRAPRPAKTGREPYPTVAELDRIRREQA